MLLILPPARLQWTPKPFGGALIRLMLARRYPSTNPSLAFWFERA